jgi:hypothetical protein
MKTLLSIVNVLAVISILSAPYQAFAVAMDETPQPDATATAAKGDTPTGAEAESQAGAAENVSTPASPASGEDEGWPREFEKDGKNYTIYQPQVEKWKDNQIQERAAVSVQPAEQTGSAASPVFGVMWLKARTAVDRASGQVTLEDMEFTKVSFPTEQSDESTFTAALKANSATVQNMSLERLKASLAIAKVEEKREAPDFKNDPPKMIYSSAPALLVLIDGKPVLRPTESGTRMLRVVNTHALIAVDQESGNYYLYVGNRWMTASADDIENAKAWKNATNTPAEVKTSLDQIKATAIEQKQADLLTDTDLAKKKKGSPQIYVSTGPAELIQTEGSPQFQPVPDTSLLYVKNSSNDVFLNTNDQHYYVLASGRWYKAGSLDAKWSYVASSSLPPDFAKIPETHPKGAVLASVAGTEQAKEAEIDNQIPQTATVDREKAKPEIKYDGEPQFKPVEGTPLQYAPNTATPVVQVNPQSYYAVQNGVWFESNSAQGPWVVASKVPPVIYTIPPSSPIYPATYVYVYGSTPRYVYTGYLPGYMGSYVDADGVVVFGTGYYYHPWIGSVWYGSPVTFGFGVGWGWGFGFGWGFHPGYWGGYRPWWGPYGYGWNHGVGPGRYVNVTNVYHNWHGPVVRSTSFAHTPYSTARFNGGAYHGNNGAFHGGGAYHGGTPGGYHGFNGSMANHAATARQNNVYSDKNGNIYRHGNQGWEHVGEANASSSHAGGASQNVPHEVENERMARDRGEQRSQAFRSQMRSSSSGMGGGSSGTSRRRNLPSSGGGHGRR